MLYIITPTGDRFCQFKFCTELMEGQTYNGDVTWIIADDGKIHQQTPTVKNWTVIHKKLPHQEGNTQGSNMVSALQECDPNSKIVIIEDDDFYGSNWLTVIANHLDSYDLAGEMRARYYNIPTGTYRHYNNTFYAALCATGINHSDAYNLLFSICKNRPNLIDKHLWHNFKGTKHLFIGDNIVGIKGIAGRSGLGRGHKKLSIKDDSNYTILKSWVGEEWCYKYLKSLNNQ